MAETSTNNRLKLQSIFEGLLGTKNVYFQPPESVSMDYPAIRYNIYDMYKASADNNTYLSKRRYTVTYITYDPDDDVIDTLAKMVGCEFERHYVANKLNHYNYLLYY